MSWYSRLVHCSESICVLDSSAYYVFVVLFPLDCWFTVKYIGKYLKINK